MRALDWVALVVGTALGILGLTADLINVGGFPGFGWKQGLLTAAGLVLVVVGAVRIVRRDRQPRP